MLSGNQHEVLNAMLFIWVTTQRSCVHIALTAPDELAVALHASAVGVSMCV